MVTGFPPFFSENLNELYESIKYQDFQPDEEFSLSENCVSLLEGLFRKDPALRLGMNVRDDL
jgi:serum/glucocorticoid-regulated kinase 2